MSNDKDNDKDNNRDNDKDRDKENDKVKDSPRNCGGVKRPRNSEQGAVDNEEQGGGGGVGQEGDGIERRTASIIIFVLFAPHLCGNFFQYNA